MKMNKRGAWLNTSDPKSLIMGFLLAYVAITVVVSTVGLFINKTIELSTVANMPLTSLFTANGPTVIMIAIGVILLVFALVLGNKKR
jgi:hypothetical protein